MNALLPLVALVILFNHFGTAHYDNQSFPQEHATGLQVDCPDAPLLLCANDDRMTITSDNQIYLGEEDSLSTSCHVHVELELSVESNQDSIGYSVGYFADDGTEFTVLQEHISILIDSGSTTITLNTAETATDEIRASGIAYNARCANADGGYHRIIWAVYDGSGDTVTCEMLLRLEDCIVPEITNGGIDVVFMPTSGTARLSAMDFIEQAIDDCSAAGELLYSFQANEYVPQIDINCDDICVNGSRSFLLEIWVADGGGDINCNDTVEWQERNIALDTAFVIVDDTLSVCPHVDWFFFGKTSTEAQEGVPNVEVIFTYDSLVQVVHTDLNGEYFTVLISECDSGPRLIISCKKTENARQGVSTLDIINIQKHLLGIELLDSPYKIIAADANNDQRVSALDLVEIRKLVLGIIPKFTYNDSWRFVPVNHEFEDPTNPWSFPEVSTNIYATKGGDFIGIKIGDVNNTVSFRGNKATRE